MADENIQTNEPQEQAPETKEESRVYTADEVQELIKGLKANNEALIAEKREAARKAQEAEEARQREHQEALKKAGKFEEFEKTIRGQYEPVLKEKEERMSKMAERILNSERKSVIASMSGMFVDESASDIISMMVKTEFDGDDVVTKFVGADGNVITTDPKEFQKFLKGHKAFSHLIKADAPTGGGAMGNKNASGGNGGVDPIQARLNRKYGKI